MKITKWSLQFNQTMNSSDKSKPKKNNKFNYKCSPNNAKNWSIKYFLPRSKSNKVSSQTTNLNNWLCAKISLVWKKSFLIFALKSKDSKNNSKTTSLRSKSQIKRRNTTRDRSRKRSKSSRTWKNIMSNTRAEGKALLRSDQSSIQ